jgi:hypothetical protein
VYYGIIYGFIIPTAVVLSVIGLFALANQLMVKEDYQDESDY